MFDLPTLDPNDSGRAADWVELCVLVEGSGVVSQAEVARIASGRALGEAPEEDIFEDEASPLVADVGRFYKGLPASIEPDSVAGRLFEKVVEACGRGLLRGSSVRFGWPIEPGWPKPAKKRVALLGEKLNLPIEKLTKKLKPQAKDNGLDVVSRLSFGDDDCGTLTLLTQCATGKHWRRKRGEPSLAAWRNVFDWNSTLIRAVAIPWRLDKGFNYKDAFMHFDAVILDRIRLVAGRPDGHLAQDAKELISTWCELSLDKLPRLSE